MTVGIVGLGLIGGSIGLALRKPGTRIIGYDPDPKAIETAQARQCIDAPEPLARVATADIVFVASPPPTIVPTLEELYRHRGVGTVITDCGSVKADVVAWARASKEPSFVPGHPMAGHERSGAAFASPWLFKPAKWILSPLKFTDKKAVQLVEHWVKQMGAIPVRMDPELHDRQVAILSHMPHVFAGLLVQLGEQLESADVAGGSWKDLTRVGGADPTLWTQIAMGNSRELAVVLRDANERSQRLIEALEARDEEAIREFFVSSQAAKRKHEPATQTSSTPARGKPTSRRRRP